jgi:hypothetical protein
LFKESLMLIVQLNSLALSFFTAYLIYTLMGRKNLLGEATTLVISGYTLDSVIPPV